MITVNCKFTARAFNFTTTKFNTFVNYYSKILKTQKNDIKYNKIYVVWELEFIIDCNL